MDESKAEQGIQGNPSGGGQLGRRFVSDTVGRTRPAANKLTAPMGALVHT